MLVNPTWLIDAEVRTNFVQMAQSITLYATSMTSQVDQHGVPMDNPPLRTMTSMLRDFTRVNSPAYTGSKIVEDLKEKCRESMLHDSVDLWRLMLYFQQVEESRKRK